jgi:hypothetical protein
MLEADMDDYEDLQHGEIDSRQEDIDMDGMNSKFGKKMGKRKLKDMNKNYPNEPIPSKLFKQMQTLLDFVVKYRDK